MIAVQIRQRDQPEILVRLRRVPEEPGAWVGETVNGSGQLVRVRITREVEGLDMRQDGEVLSVLGFGQVGEKVEKFVEAGRQFVAKSAPAVHNKFFYRRLTVEQGSDRWSYNLKKPHRMQLEDDDAMSSSIDWTLRNYDEVRDRLRDLDP